MAASASAPPENGEKSPDVDDETEMTSIMDAEQRRELQKAARAEAARTKEPERVTARPPAEAAALAADERMQIPKAAGIPAEALPKTPVPPPQAVEKHVAGPSAWMFVAFVLLAAAVVFALRS